MRDIFAPQQLAKVQNRRNQWTCSLCGKSFFEEKHLDRHFDSRHSHILNSAEDAVCFAKYCDIMRCKVLLAKDAISFDDTTASTDIEVWNAANAYRATIASSSGPKDLSKTQSRRHYSTSAKATDTHCNDEKSSAKQSRCHRSSASGGDDEATINGECCISAKYPQKWTMVKTFSIAKFRRISIEEIEASVEHDENDAENGGNVTSTHDESLVDTEIPSADRKGRIITEFERKKANCRTDDLERLQSRCQILVRDCIAGLLVQLSDDDFKAMEGEYSQKTLSKMIRILILPNFLSMNRRIESSDMLVLDLRSILGRWQSRATRIPVGIGILLGVGVNIRRVFLLLHSMGAVRVSI